MVIMNVPLNGIFCFMISQITILRLTAADGGWPHVLKSEGKSKQIRYR